MKEQADVPSYSLIVATFNRSHELQVLLRSLCKQELNTGIFEVVIVDQNPAGFLDFMLREFNGKLQIQHISAGRRSLSASRNAGIDKARGQFLLFPDDDCTYYTDTLLKLHECLQEQPDLELIVGSVYDRARQKHVFKKTPAVSCTLTIHNFHTFVSSIALAVRNNDVRFDEDFGIGEKYHSNEDADLILRCLKRGFRSWYLAGLQFNHPPYDARTMSRKKLFDYGIGFGALVRKHFSGPIFYLYVKVLVYQILMMLVALLKLNGDEFMRRCSAFGGRVKGFFDYNPPIS